MLLINLIIVLFYIHLLRERRGPATPVAPEAVVGS